MLMGDLSVDTSNVRVCCRVRPTNSKEQEVSNSSTCVSISNRSQVKLQNGTTHQTFTYDHAFNADDDQAIVFDVVARPMVEDLMNGYNATILAYGQTSSGKTYTMEGTSIDDDSLRGIIPRAATELFQHVEAADENIEFSVKVSYIEIYMEKIRDLLDVYKTKVNLQVREDSTRGVFVEGMTEMHVVSDTELLDVMRDGAAHRAVAATGMNEGSSRSHSVFMVTVTQRDMTTQATKSGKLYLVDLAGSEMVRKTKASGQQLEEAKTINRSLTSLGMVINALTDTSMTHVPYRDSKLTRVLQESLGGNSRTALVINVSPSSYNASETLSTLRFGQRAKAIRNCAVVNAAPSVDELQRQLLEMEKKLQKQNQYLQTLEQKGGEDERQVVLDQQERIEALEKELMDERDESNRRAEEIRSLCAKLDDAEAEKEQAKALAEMIQKEKREQASRYEEQLILKDQEVEDMAALLPSDDTNQLSEVETQLRESQDRYRQLEQVSRQRESYVEQLERQVQSSDTDITMDLNRYDRQYVQSLQQKMQQLIHAYRQLLRNNSSLELEATDAQKKLVNRDQRLVRLEKSNKTLTANMRAQAEQHTKDLTKLRDEMLVFRSSQRSQADPQRSSMAMSSSFRPVRGGMQASGVGDHVVRPIRGGRRKQEDVSSTIFSKWFS